MLDQTVRMNDNALKLAGIEEEIRKTDLAQKAHDLLLNQRRDTRSNDTSGLVNQAVQAYDHARKIWESNKERLVKLLKSNSYY